MLSQAGSMLTHRLRRWANMKPALGQRIVCSRGGGGTLSVVTPLDTQILLVVRGKQSHAM